MKSFIMQKNRKTGWGRRLMSFSLALLMAGSGLGEFQTLSAWAKESTTEYKIVGFATLETAVTEQVLPLGATQEDILFPDSLCVTATFVTEDSKTDDSGQEQQEGEAVTKPEQEQTENNQPEEEQPEGGQMEEEQSEGSQPESNQPEGSQSEGNQPEDSQPEGSQSEGSQSEGNLSESNQPEEQPEKEPSENGQDKTTASTGWDNFLDMFRPMTVYAAEIERNAEEETKEVVLTGVTWKIDEQESDAAIFDGTKNGFVYTYVPVIPETDSEGNTYFLAENVELPRIYVLVGEMQTSLLTAGNVYDIDQCKLQQYSSNTWNIMINKDSLSTYEGATLTGQFLTDEEKKGIVIDGVTVHLTIKDLSINRTAYEGTLAAITLENNATLHLTLEGENYLQGTAGGAGIAVEEGSTLVITKQSTGKLTAVGGNYYRGASGIGANGNGEYDVPSRLGTIIIEGGTIVAQGGTEIRMGMVWSGGAGIGGAGNERTGQIMIRGGEVTATGGAGAAGIGAGFGGCVSTILISGGTVVATAGRNAAAIGCGNNTWVLNAGIEPLPCGDITFSGGNIVVNGDVGYGKVLHPEMRGGGSVSISGNPNLKVTGKIDPSPSGVEDKTSYTLEFQIYDGRFVNHGSAQVSIGETTYLADTEIITPGLAKVMLKFYAEELNGTKAVTIASDGRTFQTSVLFEAAKTGYTQTIGTPLYPVTLAFFSEALSTDIAIDKIVIKQQQKQLDASKGEYYAPDKIGKVAEGYGTMVVYLPAGEGNTDISITSSKLNDGKEMTVAGQSISATKENRVVMLKKANTQAEGFYENLDISKGNITFEDVNGELKITYYEEENGEEKEVITYYEDSYTIIGQSISKYHIIVKDTGKRQLNLVLDNVTIENKKIRYDSIAVKDWLTTPIPIVLEEGAVTRLELLGQSTLSCWMSGYVGKVPPAIYVPQGATLLIEGNGSLELDGSGGTKIGGWTLNSSSSTECKYANAGKIIINGGNLTLEGGGIGGGRLSDATAGKNGGGTVEEISIRGGKVNIQGNDAVIGAGKGFQNLIEKHGTLTITGGTVTGNAVVSAGTTILSGGSIEPVVDDGKADNQPVYRTTVDLNTLYGTDAQVGELQIDGYAYGTNDIYTDANGKIYLYLPEGTYTNVAIAGRKFYGTVSSDDSTNELTLMPELQINQVVTTETTASIEISSDVAGTIYYVLSKTPPTVASAMEAMDGVKQEEMAAGEKSISFSGLTPNTKYTCYLALKNASGVYSEIREGILQTKALSLKGSLSLTNASAIGDRTGDDIRFGDSLTAAFTIENGYGDIGDCTFEWYEVVGDKQIRLASNSKQGQKNSSTDTFVVTRETVGKQIRCMIKAPSYRGELEETSSVVKAVDISKEHAVDTAVSGKYYTGEPISLTEADITLKLGEQELLLGTDYIIVQYENHTEISTPEAGARVLLRGMGACTGERWADFEILQKSISETAAASTVEWTNQDVIIAPPQGYSIAGKHSGSSQTPKEFQESLLITNESSTGEGTEISYYLRDNTDHAVSSEKSLLVKIDKTAPDFGISEQNDGYGITISQNNWKEFLKSITFGWYTNTSDVSIQARDAVSGISEYYYYVDKAADINNYEVLTKEKLDTAAFEKTSTGAFSFSDDGNKVVYAYAVDKAGNRSPYICSEGLVIDREAPKISITEPREENGTWSSTTDTTATIHYTASEAGTVMYFYIKEEMEDSANDFEEKAAQIEEKLSNYPGQKNLFAQIGNDGGWEPITENVQIAAMQAGENEILISGLTPNKQCRIYLASIDKTGNLQAAYETLLFKTKKKMPVIEKMPTLSGIYGVSISNLSVTPGKAKVGNVEISGEWKVTETGGELLMPGTTQSCEVTFIPNEQYQDAYEKVTVRVVPVIAKRPVTLHVADLKKEYGEEIPSVLFQVDAQTPLVGNDRAELTQALSVRTTATKDSDTGVYPFTVTSNSPKYEITIQYHVSLAELENAKTNGELTIGKAKAAIIKGADYRAQWEEQYDYLHVKSFALAAEASHKEAVLAYQIMEAMDTTGNAIESSRLLTVSSKGIVTLNGAGSARILLFLPATKNYEAAQEEVFITVKKAQIPPNQPGDTMYVSGKWERVSDVELPKGWSWKAEDMDKVLPMGTPVTILAEYIAEDRGNYENVTVSVTITRAECTHDSTEYRNAVTATCSTIGNTGELWCLSGNHKIRDGYAIPEDHSNHTKLTIRMIQPATFFAEGLMEYSCSDCGYFEQRKIARLSHGEENQGSGSDISESDNSESGTTEKGGKTPLSVKTKENQSQENDKNSSTEGNIPRKDATQPKDAAQPRNDEQSKEPFIRGENEKSGWEVIHSQTEDAAEGEVIHVDMNGTTRVPGNIFDAIRGKDVTVIFELGEGIFWTVHGNDITNRIEGEINFGVTMGAQAENHIPVEVINQVTGERYFIYLTLAYEGEFGFEATLTINMDAANAGLYANLFYYNPESGELEFVCAGRIGEDGNTELIFTHASDYTIVIDTKPMDGSSTQVMEESKKASVPSTDMESNITEKEAHQQKGSLVALWLIPGVILLLAGVFLATYLTRKRFRR